MAFRKERWWRFCIFFLLGALCCKAIQAQSTPARRTYHILLASEAEAVDVRKEIVSGDSTVEAFKAAARKHSKDGSTRPLGGDRGWVDRSGRRLDRNFHYAVWRQKVGRPSGQGVQSSSARNCQVTNSPFEGERSAAGRHVSATDQCAAEISAVTPALISTVPSGVFTLSTSFS